MSNGPVSYQLVAGVFRDPAVGKAALAKLRETTPQLSEAGVRGVLTVEKGGDGRITAGVVDIPGASVQARTLMARTRSALERPAIGRRDGGNPATELAHALMPGALAVGVFVTAAGAEAVEMGMQRLGAQVLSHADLQRIGAGTAGVPDNGTLDGDATSASPAVTPTASAVFDWDAEYADSLGLQAFIYGFPYIYLAECRYKWTNQPRDPQHVPYSAVGQFWHAPDILDARYQDGGCPNNDTMYSIAWIDLSREPMILSHPDMGERYFSFQLAGMNSDNFDYVGQRTTGSAAGDFALVGPGWRGKLPDGVKATAPAPTPWILCLGRTLVDGADDVANVRGLQSRFRLTPLSMWGKPAATAPENRDVLKPIEVTEDPLGPWKLLNAVLAENPPPGEHSALLKLFATIGIGPGLDVETQPDDLENSLVHAGEPQPEVVKKSLVRAAGAGMQLIKQYFSSGQWATVVNGWRYPPRRLGRAGDDFLLRAGGQALGGIVANDPPEAVYLVSMGDADGNPFSGDERYALRFERDTLPPVDAFWSLTMYKEDMNLVPNPAGRYSIGDRSAGLQRDPDGALTISIQAESPEGPEAANWLPCPADGTWFVVLRLYRPRPEVVSARWACPPIVRRAW